MEYLEYIANPLSLCGIVFIIAGILTYKFPPKHINSLYGYRTKASMKDQESWEFAQTYSAKKMMIIGFVMLLLSINFNVFDFSTNLIVIIGLVIIVFAVLYLILKTENAIRTNNNS